MKSKFLDQIISAAIRLLLSVAIADEKLEDEELNIIRDIVIDFFNLDEQTALQYMAKAKEELATETDLFEDGELLNNHFSYTDKIDFIRCVFEVGFADHELHYMENYTIKKIANILNIEHRDLIEAKIEVRSWES
ncbi:MAG: TerB family tellurite resistance protein [FCB group bacterium]|nr:TerB family tellurite resistance protein [FCB group bacterium]